MTRRCLPLSYNFVSLPFTAFHCLFLNFCCRSSGVDGMCGHRHRDVRAEVQGKVVKGSGKAATDVPGGVAVTAMRPFHNVNDDHVFAVEL